jgi:type I restriction enzyme, S subunit
MTVLAPEPHTPDFSVLTLSEVRLDNSRARLDASYFSRLAVYTHRRIEALPHVRLGEQCAVFRKGIFDIKADTYESTGVPFIRIANLGSGLLDSRGIAFISLDAHAAAASTALRFGDFVLSKTAYASAALVTVPECNVSQDVIAASLSPDGREVLTSGFVVAFLTSRYGNALMQRQFQGNVQEHLALDDGRALIVPTFSMQFQDAVHATILAAHDARFEAEAFLAEADRAVETALGRESWTARDALAYTGRLHAVVAADRLDAEYYHPAKFACLAALRDLGGEPLSSDYDNVRSVFDARRAGAGELVRNFDLGDALSPVLDDTKPPVDATTVKSIKKRFESGDVVTSRLRAYLRETALVQTSNKVPAVGSTEFLVLRRKRGAALSQAALLAFLRSEPVQTILRWSQDGSHHPRYDAGNLLAIPVPERLRESSEQIDGHVAQAIEARARSRDLLASAKLAVEMAIDESEGAALAYLDGLLHK